MLRQFHSLPGLILGLVVMVLAVSGAILSVDPALERMSAPSLPVVSVADLAQSVSAQFAAVERIDRSPNGAVVVSYEGADGFASVQIDPATGAVLRPSEPSAVMRWVKGLHRSFLLDDIGRAAAGVSAGVMALMAVTGLMLLAAALGGWRRIAQPVRGGAVQRWHGIAGRLAAAMLAVSAATGVYMSLATFGVFDDGSSDSPAFPFEVAGTAPAPVASLAALQAVDLTDLRRLTFPAAGDPTDVFGLQTAGGEGYVDQATGEALNWLPHSTIRRVSEVIYLLHTGQGLWWFGLLLGLGALAVPVLSVTGALIWWGRQRAHPRLKGAVRADQADVVILVGSEGGTTWGFAATLGRALQAAGRRVHLAPMNALGPMPAARALIVLAATYGEGVAPASAKGFLDRLKRYHGDPVPVAVLGFGDRMFARFSAYGDLVAETLADKGWPELLPPARIDRQSTLDFAAWGSDLGKALGHDGLTVDHVAALPPLTELELTGREAFGAGVDAPSVILRFAPVARKGWRRIFGARLPRFEAGDLVGILPAGSDLPRLYSLASSRRDGWLEIAVRRFPGGLCSGYLHDLKPGDRIRAFIRPNPMFRPAGGRAPVILVASGCGIGPMAGFVRRNPPGRPMELYFGARDPEADFLYQRELAGWKAEGRLSRLVTAFSRVKARAYVQDRLREDAHHLRGQIAAGGQVLVCGGSAMARAAATEIGAAIAPLGLTIATLKAEGRYHEDVY
ncbi:PepSY domain-containing protein [Paracoccaceae bacterium Fryx2]|nr:PepSY domain-containing protein [Paracoccaceae bacterium Fryx2]